MDNYKSGAIISATNLGATVRWSSIAGENF